MANEKQARELLRRKPRGRHLAWSEADLDAMTSPEVLAAVAEEVVVDWRSNAPVEGREALEASEGEEI